MARVGYFCCEKLYVVPSKLTPCINLKSIPITSFNIQNLVKNHLASIYINFAPLCSIGSHLTAYATAGWFGWLTGQAKSPLKSIFYATESRLRRCLSLGPSSLSPRLSVCLPSVHLSLFIHPKCNRKCNTN